MAEAIAKGICEYYGVPYKWFNFFWFLHIIIIHLFWPRYLFDSVGFFIYIKIRLI
jgi:hypothetical protein